MTLKALIAAAALSGLSSTASAGPTQQPGPSRDLRLERFEQWLTAVLHHRPGVVDDEIVVVGKRSNAELQILFIDATTVIRIVRSPNLASESASVPILVSRDRGGQTLRSAPYTPGEISRLKQIACAVGGVLDGRPCEWTKPEGASDAALSSLSSAATAVRHDMNANFIVRLGALMHTDVAMLGLAAPSALDLSPGQQSIRMSISDGHQTGLTQPDLHWEFARKLMDLVAAPGSVKPAPGGDAMVRRWYIATSAWMQLVGHHENIHMNHGREIFPDDPDLALLSGAQHEAYATPSVQTAVRSAFLPTGVRLDVGSERGELRDAEKDFRRALELKPDFAEAHVRLGRVLYQTGRDAEAVAHLTRGLDATRDSLLLYYGSLFLGAAQEKLGQFDTAKAVYERAATLYPSAQSPLLGLSELARRAGRRDEALKAMEKVYELGENSRDEDPWWRYTYVQGRDADELIDALQKPFRLADSR
jgi:hypothetical protein